MNAKINKFKNKITTFMKKNSLFILINMLSSVLFMYGISMAIVPLDKQCQTEILNSINNDAKQSKFGLSLNSISITPIGNSDYWIYSDNELEDFQMRNQLNDETRDYVFCAYEPNNNSVPFSYKNINCTTILFESKFEKDNFYFNLPLLCGEFPRYYYKNDIFITDNLASKILDQGQTYQSLINETISSVSVSPRGEDTYSYTIKGILNTNNNLGNFLNAAFGEDIVFLPEYNIFQMKGSLYFCGSTNLDENNEVVDFVYNKYKAKNNNARDLATGYKIEYKFYDYFEDTSSFKASERDERLNSIINGYNNNSLAVCLFGTIISISLLTYQIISTYLFLKTANLSKTTKLTIVWIIQSFSLLCISVLFKYAPIISILAKTKFLTFSKITSGALFLSWIFTTFTLSILAIRETNLNEKC